MMELHYQYLQIVADQIGETDDIISDENMKMIANLHEYTDLELSAIIEPDGTSHYDNGTEKNVAHRSYFQEAMEGKQVLSDPLESSVDQETRVVLSVPIKRDEVVVGVLGASYNVTALSRLMFNDTFGGIGYSLIVTQDGEIIAYDGVPSYHKKSYGMTENRHTIRFLMVTISLNFTVIRKSWRISRSWMCRKISTRENPVCSGCGMHRGSGHRSSISLTYRLE